MLRRRGQKPRQRTTKHIRGSRRTLEGRCKPPIPLLLTIADRSEQNQRRTLATPRSTLQLISSAAELRAAAAEKRLANLAGPSTLVKIDPDSDEDKKGEFGEEDQPDVKDPHIGYDERRRNMEAEMNEDEKRDLRGGWEDFVKIEPGEPGPSRPSKRRLEDDEQPARQGKDKMKSTFGSDMIERERLKGLGMVQTTLSKTSSTVGSHRELDSGVHAEKVTPPLDNSQWECKLCTFVNIADHGRCGES